MTAPVQENQVQTEQRNNDKDLNFRKLEEKYERQLTLERNARIEAEAKLKSAPLLDDDEDDEPYVDKKRLNKTLAKHGQLVKQETQSEIQRAVQTAIHEERKQNWVKSNPDFYDTLKYAEKLAELDPDLADSILEMPEGFERQKLVYKSIKALGVNKPQAPQQTIQDKIDANKRSPYYQPSGMGAAPYASAADYSAGGQKQAYDKMQALKASLRL